MSVIEAFADITDAAPDFTSVPEHICETLWSPIAKKPGADTIQAVRDLEVPSEDTKVLERLHALLLDECVGGTAREHNEAFISGGNILVNLFTMHEQYHPALTKRELHLLLLLDCAKGFYLLSHAWITRVLQRAGLLDVLLLSISRLVFNQIAYLIFSGIVFDSVIFKSGLRQRGPLSGLLFIICCACLLASISISSGVIFANGFRDDFQSLVRGIRAVRSVMGLVKDFEQGSGLVIHRTKSKFIPIRNMSATERRTLNNAWEGASVADQAVRLGAPVGRGTTTDDMSERGLSRINDRISVFQKTAMSWTMRVLAIDTFDFSVVA